jgi:hypothetical protein
MIIETMEFKDGLWFVTLYWPWLDHARREVFGVN